MLLVKLPPENVDKQSMQHLGLLLGSKLESTQAYTKGNEGFGGKGNHGGVQRCVWSPQSVSSIAVNIPQLSFILAMASHMLGQPHDSGLNPGTL